MTTPERETFSLDVFEVYERTRRFLCTPQMIGASEAMGSPLAEAEIAVLRQTHQWVEKHIFKVVEKKKGLKEAVCPFARPAMDARLLFYSVGKPSDPCSKEAIAEEIRYHMAIYKEIKPKDASENLLRSIILVFPDTPHELILDAVALKNSDIKTSLMENDIMIGEFFKDSPFPATWDETIFPLQSPVPFYAMRPFIESDWRFIHGEKRWRDIYKRRFGEPPQGDQYKLPARLKTLLEKVGEKSRRLFK